MVSALGCGPIAHSTESHAKLGILTPHHLAIAQWAVLYLEDEFLRANHDVGGLDARPALGQVEHQAIHHATAAAIDDLTVPERALALLTAALGRFLVLDDGLARAVDDIQLKRDHLLQHRVGNRARRRLRDQRAAAFDRDGYETDEAMPIHRTGASQFLRMRRVAPKCTSTPIASRAIAAASRRIDRELQSCSPASRFKRSPKRRPRDLTQPRVSCAEIAAR